MATKGHSEDTGERLKEIFSSIDDSASMKQLAGNTDERDSIALKEVLGTLKSAEGSLTLKFPSAEGHHCITYADSEEFAGVYVGPFGPENRPASMSQDAIEQLWNHADDVSVEPTEQTSLADTVVGSLLKK